MDFNLFRTAVNGEEQSDQDEAMSPAEIFANAESVALWYEQQSANLDLVAVFQKISVLLAELKAQAPDLSTGQLQAVMRLDDLHHAHYQELHSQFAHSTLLPQFRVQDLQRQLVSYLKGFVEAYLPFLRSDSPEIQGLLLSVIARMMRHTADWGMLSFYRYMPFEPTGWWLAHQLYGYGEQRDCLTLPVQLFEDQTATSIDIEYKSLLLMSLIHCDHLTPTQLHATLGLVRAEVAKHLVLSEPAPTSSAGFFVRREQESAPYFWSETERATLLSEADLVDLYEINTQGAVLLIRTWLATLNVHELPYTFRDLADPIINTRLLATLKSVWNPQNHLAVRQPRNPTGQVRQIKVIHSLLDLHRLLREEKSQAFDFHSILAATAPQKSLDDTPANKMAVATHEKGVIDGVLKDISESGWGLDWVERADERLSLGALLGLEIQDKKWAVGVLRRIHREKTGSMRLGVGKLSAKPVAVTLGLPDGVVANLLGAEWLFKNEIMAILLPQKQDGVNVAQLILPSAAYQISREYRLRVNDTIYQVALGALIESGVDWQVCYLRILSKPKAA